jgi:hypothetical protein
MANDSVRRMPGAFRIEQLPQRRLLGVIGAGGIARRGPDALILLADQPGAVELLARGIAPKLAPHPLVHALRQCLGQAVREGLQHDAAVVIVRRLEARHVLIDADARRHGERPRDSRRGRCCAGAMKSARQSCA